MEKLTVMLYVKNISETAKFWHEYLGFEKLEEIVVEGYQSIVIGNSHHDFSLQLFDQTFIKKYSPEVSLETPSLMFYTQDIGVVHKKLLESGHFVGELMQQGDRKVFNFADNEARYFAISSLS